MKRLPKEYEKYEFYGAEEDIENHQQKIVKVRTVHQCCQCDRKIIPKEFALNERGFLDGEPVSAYTCIECCDKWIDEMEEDETEEDETEEDETEEAK